MKNTLFTGCFFLIIFCFGQNHRFFYNFEYKIDTLGTKSEDLLVLLITNNENIFLSNKFIEIDSINSKNSNERHYINPQFNSILKYSKKEEKFTSFKKLDMDYYSYDFKTKLDWKILPEKKKILGLQVQKAIAKYGGRNWIAWFSHDIQMTYGPYVFYGLPGLVLEVYDNENNFHYSLVKNLNSLSHDFNLDNVFEQEPIKIDKKDWGKVQTNYYNNPLYNYKTIGWIMHNKDGSQFTPQDYRVLEIKIKEGMKRYNNPIELDEKIFFK